MSFNSINCSFILFLTINSKVLMELSFVPCKAQDKIFLPQQLLLNKCTFFDGELLILDNGFGIYTARFCVQLDQLLPCKSQDISSP